MPVVGSSRVRLVSCSSLPSSVIVKLSVYLSFNIICDHILVHTGPTGALLGSLAHHIVLAPSDSAQTVPMLASRECPQPSADPPTFLLGSMLPRTSTTGYIRLGDRYSRRTSLACLSQNTVLKLAAPPQCPFRSQIRASARFANLPLGCASSPFPSAAQTTTARHASVPCSCDRPDHHRDSDRELTANTAARGISIVRQLANSGVITTERPAIATATATTLHTPHPRVTDIDHR
jgi:hypothetical protein